MDELIKEILFILHDVNEDLIKVHESNNKSAAQRVRVNSTKLEKLFKEFRKRSIYEVSGKTKRV